MEKIVEKEHEYVLTERDMLKALGYAKERRKIQATRHTVHVNKKIGFTQPWDDY